MNRGSERDRDRHSRKPREHDRDREHRRSGDDERHLVSRDDRRHRGRADSSPENDRDRVHHSSRKRKEHDRSFEDYSDEIVDKKRSRGSVERKERRKCEENGDFEESDEEYRKKRKERRFSDNLEKGESKKEERRYRDDKVKEDLDGEAEVKRVKDKYINGDKSNECLEKGGSSASAAVKVPPMVGQDGCLASASACSHPLPNKVSLNTTTNENEGIIRSDEVHGNSSTDGTTASKAGKSSLTHDAIERARISLMQKKGLAEKLQKLREAKKKVSTSNSTPIPQTPVQTTLSATGVPAVSTSSITNIHTTANDEAVKRAQELAMKVGYRQDPVMAPLANLIPGLSSVSEIVMPQKTSKVHALRLDAQGREIDEHGNVINMPKLTNLSTLKVNINKQKKEAFQILRPNLDVDLQSNPHFDDRMGINKTKLLRPKRMSFQFVDEGKWSKQAEIIKIKNQFGEAQSKELKVKQNQLAKAKAEPDDNPNLIAIGERVFKEKKKEVIPDIEWWDKPLLPSGIYTDDAEENFNQEKITLYVEHPLPIEPPAEPAPPPPQPLKLTKKEQKKLRTQRRLAKEKDRQEMIRQGLLEPPKPKVKMSNLMKVLGSEATQDPTRMEMEIRTAAAEREQAHVDRNIARKLTPAERREKKERKLFDDNNALETIVSVYKINDLSHPQTRFKVDVNAQENRLTGCAVISDDVSVVVVEGGKKSIKRYGKLMLSRINWAAAVNEDGDGDEGGGKVNKCALVWQGSVAKHSFHRFLVHQCRSEAAARKVFADAGVPHYWDLALNFTDDLM